jgi:rubrerythrin
MGRFRVDPKLVHEIRTKDGTRYIPSPSGYVSVAHRHERELERSDAHRDRHEAMIEPVRLTVPEAQSRTCETCGFTAWLWTTQCPRCGETLS